MRTVGLLYGVNLRAIVPDVVLVDTLNPPATIANGILKDF